MQEAGTRLGRVGAVLLALGLALLLPMLRLLLPTGALRFARGLPTVVVMRGLLAGAFFAGEAYLRDSPDATDRASIEAAIGEERRKLPTTPQAKRESGAEGAPFYKKWWFWTATGAAVVALGVGLGVGLSRPTMASYREVTWQ